MSSSTADRNLLLGILALQMDFVSRDQLIEGMQTWVLQKSQPLADILEEKNHLTASRKQLLVALVQEHLDLHDNNPQKSLGALSSLESVRQDLEQLADPDLAATLIHVGPEAPLVDPKIEETSRGNVSDSSGARFRILRPHAKGGLGQVSVALDEELHREVALKEIQPQHADRLDSRSRFLLEAEVTGGLEHPGIVPVYSLGHYADGRPYYAMRFVKGDNLKQAIARFHGAHFPNHASDRQEESPPADSLATHQPGNTNRNTNSPFESVEFRNLLGRFVDVCQAIAYAHSRGVLHRDLKPGNVMLGNYGETLVVDWGLAKPVGKSFEETRTPSEQIDAPTVDSPLQPRSGSGSAPTLHGQAMGTPQFMSPEQAAGKIEELGPPSDVYALGATLYAVLTGNPPIAGNSADDVLRKVQAGEFPPPRQRNESIPKPLEAICLKAMQLEPEQRYASASQLANDVERFLADEPVLAFEEPFRLRAARWMRQHRTLVTTLAATAAMAFLGLAIGLFVVTGLNRELDQSNDQLRIANEQEREQRENAVAAESQAKIEEQKAKTLAGQLKLSLQETQLAKDQEAAQRTIAETKQKEAEQERDRAAQVTKTFISTLRSPDPERNGKQITVFELLKRAETELPDKLKTQPIALAELLNAIGESYMGLGLYREAIAPQKLAQDLYAKQRGPDHLDTLSTQISLVNSYLKAGQGKAAVALAEQMVKTQRTKHGLDHDQTAMAQMSLATAYADAGRWKETISICEEVLKSQKPKPDSLEKNLLVMGAKLLLLSGYGSTNQKAKAMLLMLELPSQFQQMKKLSDGQGGKFSMPSIPQFSLTKPETSISYLQEVKKTALPGWDRITPVRSIFNTTWR